MSLMVVDEIMQLASRMAEEPSDFSGMSREDLRRHLTACVRLLDQLTEILARMMEVMK
jgi:hypothetical protein